MWAHAVLWVAFLFMSELSMFSISVAFVTDNESNAVMTLSEVNTVASAQMVSWKLLNLTGLSTFDVVIFDIDLMDVENVMRLKMLQSQSDFKGQTIFATDIGNRAAIAQTNALGAHHVIARPINNAQLISTIADIYNARKNMPGMADKQAGSACLAIADMMDTLTTSARKGAQLPLDQIYGSCENVFGVMADVDTKTWLKAVRVHSSYTHRHIMVTAGFSALFGVKFGITYNDIEQLTLGAILHDIGNLKIPATLIDKTGKLTTREKKILQQHPVKGYEMLERHGQFNPEILSIVRHHHELLDGSGYPDQLSGAQIPDIVRVMTIVDIFSSLIDAKVSKTSVEPKVAFEMLVDMGDKLDQDIVRGFEPVALDNHNHPFMKKIQGKVAA